MNTTVDIEKEAAGWLARKDAGWSTADEAALESWLAESTAHRVAFLRLNAAWGRADRLAALGSPSSQVAAVVEDGAEQAHAPSNWGKWPRFAVAAALTALAIGSLIGVSVFTGQGVARSTYQTEVGGREFIPLADGSRVELNTDTRLRTSVSKAHRMVWLDRGEAYFEIAHDTSRPFVVVAGLRRVTVLGTKFSVRRDGDDVQVKVIEGRVAVDSLVDADHPAPTSVGAVRGGQVMIVKEESALVMARSVATLHDELSWRQGLLVMDQWTLAQAASEFNRYNRTKMTIAPSVADMRLGGSFEAANVEAFARLLHEGFGLKVQLNNDQIVVSDSRIPD